MGIKTTIFVIFITFTVSCNQDKPYMYQFSLEKLAEDNSDLQKVEKIDAYLYSPSTDSSFIELTLSDIDINWKKVNYLVCDIYHENDYSALLYFQFFRKEGIGEKAIIQQGKSADNESKELPRIVPKIGILPQLQTQVIFSLSHLDGQNVFLYKYPRQLKGTVLGSRMEKSAIEKIRLVIEPHSKPEFLPKIRISSLYLSEQLPPTSPKSKQPVMDEFGQWTKKSWKGKVSNLTEMKSNHKQLEEKVQNAKYPSEWSRYGGYKLLNFGGTGYFRTHYDGKRWWLVDPEGYAFLSSGVDCIGYNASTLIDGNQDLFSWLPDREDSVYSECFSPNNKGEGTLFNYYMANFIKMYGPKWKETWMGSTRDMLKTYRFNTVANWSNLDFAAKARIPYVLPLRNFPTAYPLLFRDFPDVFSIEYENKAKEYAQQLEPFKNDPYLIGYFLANEPKWAFGEFNLAYEMFATNQLSITKKRCTSFISEKYGNSIDKFNEGWSMSLNKFDDLMNLSFRDESELTDVALEDLKEFSEIMVRQYIKVVCDAVDAVDQVHLNLGLRYAWISSDLCYIAGEYFDVFSINGYNFPGPPETNDIFRRSQKPIIIGEFHFGSIDRGLPATGIVGTANQKERAQAYRYYVENGFARPEIVGLHYFQWIDQPVLGRSDGENYNIGFMDICGSPYQELSEAATLSNERIYQIANKEVEPFSKVAQKIPQIYY